MTITAHDSKRKTGDYSIGVPSATGSSIDGGG